MGTAFAHNTAGVGNIPTGMINFLNQEVCIMRKIFLMAVLLVVFGMAVPAIAATQHTTDYECKTCHIVHTADPNGTSDAVPLWAGNDPDYSAVPFAMYVTKVHGTQTAKPEGDTKICLSCHDGSNTYDSAAPITGGSLADLGTDLTNMHPISFIYNSATTTGYTDLGDLDPGLVDSSDRVGCTSCHEIHSGATGDKALRYGTVDDSVLCGKCHIK